MLGYASQFKKEFQMKKLIALTGAAGSGKSTVAEYLSQLEPSSMERKREHNQYARDSKADQNGQQKKKIRASNTHSKNP